MIHYKEIHCDKMCPVEIINIFRASITASVGFPSDSIGRARAAPGVNCFEVLFYINGVI